MALALLMVAAGALLAQSGGASSGSTSSPATLSVIPSGAGHLLRLDGLATAAATPVFTLGNGQQVSVVASGKARCLLRSFDGHPAGEACTDTDGLEAARSITVGDECAPTGQNRMEITGLAPEGSTTVRLDYTDGTHETTDVVDGAFRFEGTNPASGRPYPTEVEWVAGGVSEGSAHLPVKGDEFCLPAEEPNE